MSYFVERMYTEFLIYKSLVWITNNRFYIRRGFNDPKKPYTIRCSCDVCEMIKPYVVDRRDKKC